MTEDEMEARFAEASDLLTQACWTREPLYGLAHAIAQARDQKDPMEAERVRELRHYIRDRSAFIRKGLDELLDEVPCTPYSKILFMELLTGYPALPSAEVDLDKRASELLRNVQQHVYSPWEERHKAYDELLQTEGQAKAHAWEQEFDKWNSLRRSATSRDLSFAALLIFQHLLEAGEQWMKRPKRESTFRDSFTLEQWTKLERAMTTAGIAPKEGKGKNDVVAAVHAASAYFGKHLPTAGHWLEQLRGTFPTVSWSEKCVPEARLAHRTKSYQRAFQAVLDGLQ